jgi:dTMP kinase
MGKFIVLEGIEGVGKTTNMDFICRYLAQKQQSVVRTREPGGTPLSEKMRDIMLHTAFDEPLSHDAELLLMFAARAQHLVQVIKPALAGNQWVVSDRFTDASYAYQGGGRNIDAARIAILEQWVQGDLRPDKVIILDAPVKTAIARTQHRQIQDRIEQETAEFFSRVRNVYLQRAAHDPMRYQVIDATQSLETVQEALQIILDQLLETP